MAELFYAAAVLACPVGMGAMMWFMMRGHRKHSPGQPTLEPGQSAVDGEIARLQAEVDQLRAAQREASVTRGGAAPTRGPGEAI